MVLIASAPSGYKRTGPPLGIAYLSAVLRKAGYSVNLVEPSPLDMPEREIIESAVSSKPLVTGLYCCTMDRYEAFNLAARIRKRLSETHITMGGPHVTFVDRETLRHVGCLDSIVRGEGEKTMLELVERVKDRSPLDGVLGITYRDGSEVHRNPGRPPIEDLDSLPLPDYELLPDLDLYAPQGIAGKRRSSVVMTSRGCLFNCSFCSSKPFWGGSRFRSPQSVGDELQYLVEEQGVEFVKFYDDVFTLNKERTIEICEQIVSRDLDIGFFILTRVDRMDREIIQHLREAGCEQIQYGLESGSQEVVDGVGKGIKVSRAREVLAMTSEAGIQSYLFLMLGLRGETEKDIEATLNFVYRNSRNIGTIEASINSIYPGSPDYHYCLDKGLIDEDIWFTYRNDDPLLYKDTPPFPSPIPLRRLKAYRRLIYLLKTGLTEKTTIRTLSAALGYVKNHFLHPDDMALLGPKLRRALSLKYER